MSVRTIVAAMTALLAAAAVLAGVELVLLDGQVIRGEQMRRDGDVYVVHTATGDITFPVDLVREVRLTETAAPKPTTPFGMPEGPSGIKVGPAETIAGPPVEPPRTEDQLRVLGKPSEFQKNIVDSEWVPTTDWNMDPTTQNNWAPSQWAKSPIDPNWTPTSAYDTNKDVLAESRSTWQKGAVDSSWKPTDGFRKSGE